MGSWWTASRGCSPPASSPPDPSHTTWLPQGACKIDQLLPLLVSLKSSIYPNNSSIKQPVESLVEKGELKVESRVTGRGGGDLDQESEASFQEGRPTLPLLQLAPVQTRVQTENFFCANYICTRVLIKGLKEWTWPRDTAGRGCLLGVGPHHHVTPTPPDRRTPP